MVIELADLAYDLGFFSAEGLYHVFPQFFLNAIFY